MTNNDVTMFFLQICVMLVTALTLGQVARKFGQPSVFGELLGGIIIGPTVLKTVSPFLFCCLFPMGTTITPELNSFIQLGMLLFMFVAGLEVNLESTWKKRKQIFFTSLFGILLPLCLGVGVVLCFPWQQGHVGVTDQWIYALFIGTALSISALPVILKTLIDLKILKSEIGIVIMSSATINDLVGWTIFACLISIVKSSGAVAPVIVFSILKVIAFMLIMIMIGPKVCKTIVKFMNKFFKETTVFVGITIVFILLIAVIAEKLGIHPFFAAFLLGTILRKYFRANGAHIRLVIYKFAMGFFAPLYFVSIGLKVNFISSFDLYQVVVILLIACVGKVVGSSIGAVISGMSYRAAICVGFGMNSRGAIEIIVASTALELKIIDYKVFVALVIMAIVTSLISGPVIKKILDYDKSIIKNTFKQGEEYSKTKIPVTVHR